VRVATTEHAILQRDPNKIRYLSHFAAHPWWIERSPIGALTASLGRLNDVAVRRDRRVTGAGAEAVPALVNAR
jgi:hypothetical protein